MTELNKANIDKVIEAIRDENKFFNMDSFTRGSTDYEVKSGSYETVDFGNNTCGTASCICGWANHIRLTESNGNINCFQLEYFESAADWLGMNYDEADELFYATNVDSIGHKDISINAAIAVLENLKKTGKVDWNLVI